MTRSRFLRLLPVFGFAVSALVAMSGSHAYADRDDDRRWRDHERREHEWREREHARAEHERQEHWDHRYWDGDEYYRPPPVVYAPPPPAGLNFVFRVH